MTDTKQQSDILPRLREWQARHNAMMAAYNAMYAITGAGPDSALWEPVFRLWDSYTAAVAELVGDDEQWLDWYRCDCQMGQRPKVVLLAGGRTVKVSSLKALARVIAS